MLEHRVVAVLEAGRAGVVGGARDVDPPAAVRPDVAADTHSGTALVVGVGVGERAALFDVQLDEGVHPGQRLGVVAEARRVAAGSRDRLGHRRPVGVGQAEGAVGRERTGDEARSGTGDPEPGALLVAETGHGQRNSRSQPGGAQRVDRRERRDHPERAVEGPAVRDRVQVRADGHAAGRPVRADGVGVAPPGPLVAGAVQGEVQTPSGALPGEPLPQRVVLAGPGVPPVPAGRRVPADRGELGPHGVEGAQRRHGHRDTRVLGVHGGAHGTNLGCRPWRCWGKRAHWPPSRPPASPSR